MQAAAGVAIVSVIGTVLANLGNRSERKRRAEENIAKIDQQQAEVEAEINALHRQRTAEVQGFRQRLLTEREVGAERLLALQQQEQYVLQEHILLTRLITNIIAHLLPREDNMTLSLYLSTLLDEILVFFIHHFACFRPLAEHVDQFFMIVHLEVTRRAFEPAQQAWRAVRMDPQNARLEMRLRNQLRAADDRVRVPAEAPIIEVAEDAPRMGR